MKSLIIKWLIIICLILVLPVVVFSQESQTPDAPVKHALVIGNGAYTGLTPLSNPVNDANDVSAVLEYLGFTVEKILNGDLTQMEDAVIRLKNRLIADSNSYGFFFYAGHGVQSGGENYLIPVNSNIPTESYLRTRALSVQAILDDINEANNSLNVIVLDACRDNPFGWSRSGTRGLSIVTNQPADSIIVYATSAGQRASDGDGRNGLFTSQLINNLATPGLEVKEVFNRTGADVAQVSNRQQVPAIYNQFFGTAYLGETPIDFQGVIIQTTKPIIIGGKEPEPEKYWSVGLAVGSSFAAPWVIGTVHGTIAPFKYTFLEVGFDFGLLNIDSGVDLYYSMYPFAHLAFYWPFTDRIGAYVGAGGGLWMVSYRFSGLDPYTQNNFAASFTVGANLFNMINVSYSMRTNFKGMNHKASVGYSYRFK